MTISKHFLTLQESRVKMLGQPWELFLRVTDWLGFETTARRRAKLLAIIGDIAEHTSHLIPRDVEEEDGIEKLNQPFEMVDEFGVLSNNLEEAAAAAPEGDNEVIVPEPLEWVEESDWVSENWLRNQFFTDSVVAAQKLVEENKAMRKIYPAQVISYKDRHVIIDCDMLGFSLDKVNCNFVPWPGDKVEMSAIFELNLEEKNCTSNEITKEAMRPLCSLTTEGKVTRWQKRGNRYFGEITDTTHESRSAKELRRIYFDETHCEGFTPCCGCNVVADIIESDQGEHQWRATSVAAPTDYRRPHFTEEIEDEEEKDLLREWQGVKINRENRLGALIINQEKILNVCVSNQGYETRTLVAVYSHPRLCESTQFAIQDSSMFPCDIPPKCDILVKFNCQGSMVGYARDLYVFEFEDEIRLGRFLTVNIITEHCEVPNNLPADQYKYRQQQPRNYRNKNNDRNRDRLVRSHLFEEGTKDHFHRRLKPYEVPEFAWQLVEDDRLRKGLSNIIPVINEVCPKLLQPLHADNYAHIWHALVHLEEADVRLVLLQYKIAQAQISPTGDHSEVIYQIEVPHLREGRPSVVVGDSVHCTKLGDEEGVIYEGRVYKVLKSFLHLKFDPSFPTPTYKDLFEVDFQVNRSQFRRLHAAIDSAMSELGPQILFPSTSFPIQSPQVYFDDDPDAPPNEPRYFHDRGNGYQNRGNSDYQCRKKRSSDRPAPLESVKMKKINWFNKQLNTAQRRAVQNILKGEARPLPYVIFGPPGTGKTVTVVETVLQIYTLFPEARILLATPSNSAADLLTERLINSSLLVPGQMVRLVAFTYEKSVPMRIRPYMTVMKGAEDTGGQNDYFMGGTDVLQKITIGTCSTLGRLVHNIKSCNGHFTHVLIDEAGQALEPEVLLVTSLLGRPQQIVLAGDPKQLGPVVQGCCTLNLGYGTSFLERLLQQTMPYKRDPSYASTQSYNPRVLTMLTQNYRSLPEILELPNQLTYYGDLVPTVSPHQGVEPELLHKMKMFLPCRQGLPPALVFHGVRAKCRREPDSPSWFNSAEYSVVCEYVMKILSRKYSASDIGIISPYNKQVQKIRHYLTTLRCDPPKVGSVEEFQGQERLVIIFSAVRSNFDVEPGDDDGLGFLANSKRMNTAITRARALLIVIGDPVLLSQDVMWRSLIAYCKGNQAYTGCNFNLPKYPREGTVDMDLSD